MTNRREGEITFEHLEALSARIEQRMIREFDQLKSDVKDDFRQVHARVRDVKDQVTQQNGRIGKSEHAIADLKAAVRVLQVTGISMETVTPVATAARKVVADVSRTKVVGAVLGALAALAAFAEVARQVAEALLKIVHP